MVRLQPLNSLKTHSIKDQNTRTIGEPQLEPQMSRNQSQTVRFQGHIKGITRTRQSLTGPLTREPLLTNTMALTG